MPLIRGGRRKTEISSNSIHVFLAATVAVVVETLVLVVEATGAVVVEAAVVVERRQWRGSTDRDYNKIYVHQTRVCSLVGGLGGGKGTWGLE